MNYNRNTNKKRINKNVKMKNKLKVLYSLAEED